MDSIWYLIPLILIAAIIYWALKRSSDARGLDAEIQKKQENDARRFARLLLAEIKLYNDYKIQRGLKNNNLYDSLEIEIEEAKKKYQSRFGPSFASREPAEYQKYFDEALIEVLADGDKSKLGSEYNLKQIKLNESHN